MTYIGRFAPSPTGPLHMGSLITAVASYCQAKHQQGKWLLRIEDIDPPREVPGASKQIISDLDRLGFEWDGEIIYQSQRQVHYDQALEILHRNNLSYPCGCSRSEVMAASHSNNDVRYTGTCRKGLPKGKKTRSIRIKVSDKKNSFTDLIQGKHDQNLQIDIGDFVVKRADGQFAYQLAVVVDDAAQNVTEIVRGNDLLDSTIRQQYLQQCLGYTQPSYAHIPILVNSSGDKLSKQTGAQAINLISSGTALVHALCYLNQNPPESLQRASVKDIWNWAFEHWQIQKIRNQMNISLTNGHS